MNITLTMAVATCQPDLFYKSVADMAARTSGHVDLVVFGNGCEIDPARVPSPVRVVAVDSVPENRGVPFALHRMWEMAKAHYVDLPAAQHVIGYVHDDLFMREDGWNIRVASTFANNDRITLAGILGSPGLGRDEIYKKSYEFWHLSRVIATWSNLGNAETHGVRVTAEREVVFVDGVAMFLRRDFLDKVDGWSWWPESLVHHAYDYGLSCLVRRHKGRVWLVPFKANHGVGMEEEAGGGHSGTYGRREYHDLADKFGGDMIVHRAGHRWVYDQFKDVLPLRMRK